MTSRPGEARGDAWAACSPGACFSEEEPENPETAGTEPSLPGDKLVCVILRFRFAGIVAGTLSPRGRAWASSWRQTLSQGEASGTRHWPCPREGLWEPQSPVAHCDLGQVRQACSLICPGEVVVSGAPSPVPTSLVLPFRAPPDF